MNLSLRPVRVAAIVALIGGTAALAGCSQPAGASPSPTASQMMEEPSGSMAEPSGMMEEPSGSMAEPSGMMEEPSPSQ